MKVRRIAIGIVLLLVFSVLLYFAIDKQWDSVRVYYDLENTYEDLSLVKSKEIERYLWNYKFENKTFSENDITLYGVHSVNIHFIEKDTTHKWSIGQDVISYEKIVGESEIISELYEGEKGDIYRSVLKMIQD